MNLEALGWDVVVAGFWNPAILTPSGIAQRLFELPEGTPVLVEVSMDWMAPYRVRHSELTVMAERGRLIVAADEARYELLDQARQVAVRAMERLPETPLTAAGYNIRVKINEPSNEFLRASACGFDALLSDAGFSIDSQRIRRSLKKNDGLLNLEITQGEDVTVSLNFHRQSSKKEELVDWLRHPIKDIEATVAAVMEKVIQVSIGEIGK